MNVASKNRRPKARQAAGAEAADPRQQRDEVDLVEVYEPPKIPAAVRRLLEEQERLDAERDEDFVRTLRDSLDGLLLVVRELQLCAASEDRQEAEKVARRGDRHFADACEQLQRIRESLVEARTSEVSK